MNLLFEAIVMVFLATEDELSQVIYIYIYKGPLKLKFYTSFIILFF